MPKAVTTTANGATITATAAARRHRAANRGKQTVFRQRGLRLRRPDRVCLRTVRKHVLQVLRRCGAASRVMDRIWIAMETVWDVSRGAGDAGVMLM